MATKILKAQEVKKYMDKGDEDELRAYLNREMREFDSKALPSLINFSKETEVTMEELWNVYYSLERMGLPEKEVKKTRWHLTVLQAILDAVANRVKELQADEDKEAKNG